jgi:hypothetical protein
LRFEHVLTLFGCRKHSSFDFTTFSKSHLATNDSNAPTSDPNGCSLQLQCGFGMA